MTHDAAAVDVRAVSKTYPARGQPVCALREVSLQIDPGEFVALRGPSGSGKTTLLNLLAALERPDHGEILVTGTSMPALSAAAAARFRSDHIGIVFQAYNLLPQLTALENVLLAMRAAGRSDYTLATQLLERVGLADRAQHRPTELSGGEQQRVAIARALANDPALLLADEPTGNLDDEAAHTVLELLITTSRDHGRTLLLVTHAPEALAAADRVLTLRAGHLQDMGEDRGPSEQA